jgi:hypothetical protein
MFRIAINKLFKYLFARMLASHRGGLASIPGQDMSVSGTLVTYGNGRVGVSGMEPIPTTAKKPGHLYLLLYHTQHTYEYNVYCAYYIYKYIPVLEISMRILSLQNSYLQYGSNAPSK